MSVLDSDPQRHYAPTLAKDLLAISLALELLQTPPTDPVLLWLRELEGNLVIGPPDRTPLLRIRANGRVELGGPVLFRNVSTPPRGKPTGGGWIYVENGDLMYRGPHGTTTRLGCA